MKKIARSIIEKLGYKIFDKAWTNKNRVNYYNYDPTFYSDEELFIYDYGYIIVLLIIDFYEEKDKYILLKIAQSPDDSCASKALSKLVEDLMSEEVMNLLNKINNGEIYWSDSDIDPYCNLSKAEQFVSNIFLNFEIKKEGI